MADTAIAKMATRTPSTRRTLKDKISSGNEANIEAGKVPESNPTSVQEVSVSDPAKENREILFRPRKSSKKPKAAAASKKEIKQTSKELMKEMQEKLQKEIKQTSEELIKEMQEKLQELTLQKEKAEELLKEKEENLKLKDEDLQKLEFKPTTMKAKEQKKKEERKKADDSKRPNIAGASRSTPSIDACAPEKSTTVDAKLGRPKRSIKRPNYLNDYYLK